MSYTLDEIKVQMENAGISDLWGTKREVKELPKILNDNEIIKYGCSGFNDNNTVLCLCTNQRILFLDKGLLYGIKSTEIPLDMVNGVSYEKGLIFGKIAITNGANVTKLEQIDKKDAPIMADTIKKEAMNYKESLQAKNNDNLSIQHEASNNTDDLIKQLKELKKLVDEGILTQEEFKAKKKQLLGL
ncbi:hypothetical protein DKZ27_09290 [Limosilactobacillus reuteri]|uniref:PH domain-containing protein n=1 Tax=Limosilactobacillus reuteri TaxID=1598 RepID=UPI000D70473F|nr:PH domain-containing protein [Limosilactobacillus reuteri]PWT29928.1 hypothetical protein DKZ27_09290 [Limosilactobacillus reuteri]